MGLLDFSCFRYCTFYTLAILWTWVSEWEREFFPLLSVGEETLGPWCILLTLCFHLHQIIVDDDDSKVWSLYDAGPKSIRCPIIFLPPVSGTAEVFFQQVLALTGWGYRVISVSWPPQTHCSFSIIFCFSQPLIKAASTHYSVIDIMCGLFFLIVLFKKKFENCVYIIPCRYSVYWDRKQSKT